MPQILAVVYGAGAHLNGEGASLVLGRHVWGRSLADYDSMANEFGEVVAWWGISSDRAPSGDVHPCPLW